MNSPIPFPLRGAPVTGTAETQVSWALGIIAKGSSKPLEVLQASMIVEAYLEQKKKAAQAALKGGQR